MKAVFNEDGTVTRVYDEGMNMSFLGQQRIKRASNVEFNNLTKRWEVTIQGDGYPTFTHPSRKVALEWEVEYLNALMTYDNDHLERLQKTIQAGLKDLADGNNGQANEHSV